MVKRGNTEHLLVIRLSAMGDVAMVPHALWALRRENPDLRISVLTKELFRPLFKGLNVEIIPIDLEGQHKGFKGLNRLAGELKAAGISCVADLHKVHRSRILTALMRLRGIPSRSIHKSRVSKWMRMDGGCSEETMPLKHTVLRYCDTLGELGFKMSAPTAPTKQERPNPMPFAKGDGERWIGVAPFSAHRGKCYPLSQVREVVSQLAERYDRIFIHSGGGEELSFAKEMEAKYANCVAVFSAVKLEQEIDLISNLDCLISMDSFAMHVASLTATPVVSVWGATHPMLGYSGFGSDPRGVVQMPLTCRPCSTYGNKPCRFSDYHCLTEIASEEITKRVALLLKGV